MKKYHDDDVSSLSHCLRFKIIIDAKYGGMNMAKSQSHKHFDHDRYWNGVFCGVFLGCFFTALLILIIIRVQGLKVAINPEQLAKMVQIKVQEEAKNDVPLLLQGFKSELPGEINQHLDGLDDLTIGFGKSQVKLPDDVLFSIKSEFNRIIEEGIINTLNQYDTTQYQQRVGKNAYDLVSNMLNQEIIGRTYLIKTTKWFTVPVKIVATSDNQLKIEM
jgi:hypothetical protein